MGLTNQKESQDRTRTRIKEDLKASTTAHTDFAENTLPKFKRAYLKKCQEFEVKKNVIFCTPRALTLCNAFRITA